MADVNADLFDDGIISGFADGPSLHVKPADFFDSPVYDAVALRALKVADFYGLTSGGAPPPPTPLPYPQKFNQGQDVP